MKRTLLALLMIAAEAKAENIFVRMMPPKEQGQMRQDMPTTVGLPLTAPFNLPSQVQYRFSEKWLIGGGFTTQKQEKEPITYGYTSSYRYESRTQIGSAYLEYYPVTSSGFHIGLGAEGRSGTFVESYRDRDGNEDVSARGNFKAMYAGPSFGWTWIWTNGITIGFDISTRKQFSSEITTNSSANAATDTMDKVAKKSIPDIVPGTVMIGFSF